MPPISDGTPVNVKTTTSRYLVRTTPAHVGDLGGEHLDLRSIVLQEEEYFNSHILFIFITMSEYFRNYQK